MRRPRRSKGRSIGEVVTAGGTMFSRRNVPLQMLAPGILLAKLLGIHRQSWAQAIISRIRPSCRVERAIRGKGRVARPMWHGTTFARRERKTAFAIFAKKLTKLPSGGLNRGPSPSNPQQIPLGWPKRPPKTAISENAIFLCQCHKSTLRSAWPPLATGAGARDVIP